MGDSSTVFLADAFAELAPAIVGEEWTGDELKCFAHVPVFPGAPTGIAAARALHMLLPDSIRLPDLHLRCLTHTEADDWRWRIINQHPIAAEKEAARIAPWTREAEAWSEMERKNAALLARLKRAVDGVVLLARDGALQTRLRYVDVSAYGDYFDARAGVWNIDNTLRDRFASCQFGYWVSFNALSGQSVRCYLYFTRESVSRCLANLRGEGAPPARTRGRKKGSGKLAAKDPERLATIQGWIEDGTATDLTDGCRQMYGEQGTACGASAEALYARLVRLPKTETN